MNSILLQAIKKAGQLRSKLGLSMFEPVNVFDVAMNLGITVRFVDVSMEGMYVSVVDAACPNILISSLRPLPRRVFTCAHEIGHHVFGHGSKIDGLNESQSAIYDDDEYLVDSFAGAFLMPIAGVDLEFAKRGLEPQESTPLDFYRVCSVFGTGYGTLIHHCRVNRLIKEAKALELLKTTPAKILDNISLDSIANSHFKILDNKANVKVVDIEVGNYLVLPPEAVVVGEHLINIGNSHIGVIYVAQRSGITRVSIGDENAYFVRIQNQKYVGLSENRHLEE